MESSLEFSNSLNSVSSLSSRWRIFKIILIGDSGVGKTSLTYRFCAGEFPERTEPTIGVDFRERCIDIEGEKIKLQLWDTAGQERFRKSMVQQYYRNVHAVLFVYDVTHPSSFRSLPAWVEECRQNSLGQDIPRFLVGNKSDLRDLRAEDQVSREQAHKFAETHGMTFFETSAKQPLRSRVGGRQPDQVDAVFQALAARLRRRRSAPLLSTGSYTATGSFKLPPKKKPEKGVWACTC